MTQNNYISSGRYIWKRFEHKKTEEGIAYSTEIVATAATEVDAIDIVNKLNGYDELKMKGPATDSTNILLPK